LFSIQPGNKNEMIRIRLATEKDTEKIIDFQLKMALESEGLALDPKTLKDGIEAVFKDPKKGIYHVAEYDHKVVGSLLTTYEWSDWRNKWIYWLQSIYILPDHRNKGIFRMMYEHIKNEVESVNTVSGIRLYVDVGNEKAIAAYKSLGMDGEHYKVYEWMDQSPEI
jgi:GNAT superfamily N-acetyltransferase